MLFCEELYAQPMYMMLTPYHAQGEAAEAARVY